MKKKSTLANIFYNSFGTMFYYGCQWLTTILVVRLSGFEDGGNYSLAMTFTAAFAILALFNTRQYQVSDVSGEYTERTYIYSRIIAMGIAFIVCFVTLFFNDYSLHQWLVILLYMVYKCIEAWIDVYHGIVQKNSRMDYVCYSYIARGILLMVGFCGVLYWTKNLVWAIFSIAFVTLLVAVGFDRRVAERFVTEEKMIDKAAVKRLLMAMVPLVIVAVTNNLSISLPKYFLERYYNAEILGYYSSVATPSMVVQVGAATIFIPLITPLADKLKENDKRGFLNILKKVSLVCLLLSILALLASAWLGEWFLVLVFKEEIRPYTYLFVPIILSTLMISVNACLFPICTVLREIKGQLVVGIAGIVSSFIASMVLVKKYAMDGVVIALLITLGIQIIIELYCVYHKMKKWKGCEHG